MTSRTASKAVKPKLTREQLAIVRARAGRAGAAAKHGAKSPAQVEKAIVRDQIEQRLMRATDTMLNAQISLAHGQQFLYRIDKEWNEKLKKWFNLKPVLVTSQFEIENYLEELADNNGDLSDDKDEGAAYYFITTKEPSIQALDSSFNRVHGKAKETQDVNVNHTFSLVALHQKRREIVDGNAGMRILPNPPLLAP